VREKFSMIVHPGRDFTVRKRNRVIPVLNVFGLVASVTKAGVVRASLNPIRGLPDCPLPASFCCQSMDFSIYFELPARARHVTGGSS
jgi:hypothetical protein